MNMSMRGFFFAIPYACVRYCACLAQRDAEDLVGRVRLVAVLGHPDPLVAVEPRHLLDQQLDVPERDAVGALPCLPGGGGVVGVSRGARSTGGARRRRSPSRRPSSSRAGRRAATPRRARVRLVVAARAGDAAGDLRCADVRLRDALDDRVADLRVVDRRSGSRSLRADATVLRPQEGRVVRLVPGEPAGARGRRIAAVRRLERARSSGARRRSRSAADRAGFVGATLTARAAVRPGRRADDREDDLDPVRRRVAARCGRRPPSRRRGRSGSSGSAGRRLATPFGPPQTRLTRISCVPSCFSTGKTLSGLP